MIEFTWSFARRIDRSRFWYATAAAIAITAIIVSFIYGYYLFGIVAILFTGVYLLYEFNSHPSVHINISSTGIMIEGDLFPFNQIQSFAIIRTGTLPPILRLETKSRAIGSVDIFTDPTIDVEGLRLFLAGYLDENTNAKLSALDQILMGLRL